MQTFVPHTNFAACARSLDYRRLGKQRVECIQILHAMDPSYRTKTGKPSSWRNHPAVLMWAGHEGALSLYARAIVNEWVGRGYRDIKCGPQIDAYAERHTDATLPPWWGDARVHTSHQSNLIRKLASHYGPQFPGVSPDLPYVWPVSTC